LTSPTTSEYALTNWKIFHTRLGTQEENGSDVDEDELDKKRQRLALKRRERTNDEGNLTAEPDCTCWEDLLWFMGA